MAQGVMRLCEEDPTIHFKNNQETHEMIISGMGEQHLDVVVSKLKSKFGVEVTLKKPKIAYRETIRKRFPSRGGTRSRPAATDSSVMCGSNSSLATAILWNLPSGS